MKEQAPTAADTAFEPIENFIKDSDFRQPAASNKNGDQPYLEVVAPEYLGAWQVEDGEALICSATMTRSNHQAIDIGCAVLTQDFDPPNGRAVEITWMHSKNTDPSVQGKAPQSYGATVLDPSGQVVAEGTYQPSSSTFNHIPAAQALRFTVTSGASYVLRFEGNSSTTGGAMIYQVLGQAAPSS
ncbi:MULTISPECIES: hypothetical protein [Streptomyces]|uniref:Uncharacterized protein n=2 Tax=Streptomyces TaxID=1883 RepID=A0A0W7XB40_9ACTN|nr:MULTISPECIES: hypothetical protein [Streptomyces]KUF20093.1 hypothetical protein AT728_28400 [Streptomyces silvensis]MVO84280.1 hypothetical protein [Streptomyces typhae]